MRAIKRSKLVLGILLLAVVSIVALIILFMMGRTVDDDQPKPTITSEQEQSAEDYVDPLSTTDENIAAQTLPEAAKHLLYTRINEHLIAKDYESAESDAYTLINDYADYNAYVSLASIRYAKNGEKDKDTTIKEVREGLVAFDIDKSELNRVVQESTSAMADLPEEF